MAKIPVGQIFPNPEQPRKEFDEAELLDLAANIREYGLINPVAVEGPFVQDGAEQFFLIDGERRWRAAQIAGMDVIEAHVKAPMNGSGARLRLAMAMAANLQRRDMNPVETAEALRRLVDEHGFSRAELSRVTGLAASSVHNYLCLLELQPAVRDLYRSRQLSFETGGLRALLGIVDEDLQKRVASAAAGRGFSGPQLRALIARMRFRAKAAKTRQAEEPQAYEGRWNMLAQAGGTMRLALPETVRLAALETCKECALYAEASSKVCRDCPAVALLKKMAAQG